MVNSKVKRKFSLKEALPQQLGLLYLILVLVLVLFPLLLTILMSLKSPEDIISYPMWTLPQKGWYFSNYASAFKLLSRQLFTTIVVDLFSCAVVLFMSCFVAYLFERKKFPGRNVLFFLVILPMMVPGVVLLSSTYIVVATWLNLEGNLWGLILPYIAGNQIATIFMFKVFISQHPVALYESAELDGANMFRAYFHLCLPLAVPIMMIQGTGIFAAMYNDYLWPQLLFINNLHEGVLMPYLKSIIYNDTQGVQYAMYLVSGIPLIISTTISMKTFISGDFASGMKL